MTEFPLHDGRALAFTDDGGPGLPVLLFHGSPGARGFRPDAAQTRSAGVRLLTFDRRGYGDSDPCDVATVPAVAQDAVELCDHLGVDRFAVVGWSGGGPFAVACAHRAPDRVTALALVSAPGPLDEVPGGWDALGEFRRPTAEMARREPHRSVRAIGRHMEPFLADPVSFLGTGRGPDGSILADPDLGEMLRTQVRAALAPGAAGIAADLVAMWNPWGFGLDEIRVPTTVFHGELDRTNGEDAEVYAARIPGARLVRWPGAGHLAVLTHWPEVLASVT